MTNGYIGVPADGGGKKLDTTELDVGANTVERERVVIAGAADTDLAPVSATLGLSNNPAKLDVTNDEVATGATAAGTGGLAGWHFIAASSNNATVLKASAGRLYVVQGFNANASVARFLKFYDKATAPVPGTDAVLIKWVMLIWGLSPGKTDSLVFPHGLTFDNGIGYTLVSGIADNDNTNAVADEVIVSIGYK